MAFANFNPSKIINDDSSHCIQESSPLLCFASPILTSKPIPRFSGESGVLPNMQPSVTRGSLPNTADIPVASLPNTADRQVASLSKEFLVPHLQIHQTIVNRLDEFIAKNQIPHIIFHGPSGSGKQTLVREFIQRIYGGDKLKLKTHVMTVNCSHGKGIQFIREELKFFAKSNAQTKSNVDGGKSVEFKVIMLLNAHHLTVDAQSALRRCIELFSYNTRFFIVVENKDKLLNPILSRFCDIFVPEPSTDSSCQNLHQYVLSQQFQDMEEHCREDTKRKMMELNNAFLGRTPYSTKCRDWEREAFDDSTENRSMSFVDRTSSPQNNTKERIETVNRLYESGISCLDVMEWVKNQRDRWSKSEYYRAIMRFYQIKPQFRCEKLLILFMVNYLFRE